MSLFTKNIKKYMFIIPIYSMYVLIFELILGCSFGDIWDDLLQKFGIEKHRSLKN